MRTKTLDFENTWVFGCAHLDQNKAFVYGERGYRSCEEHDEHILNAILNTPANATIISLGDMFFNTKYSKAVEIIDLISGGTDGNCNRVVYMVSGDTDGRTFIKLSKDPAVRVVKLGDQTWLKDENDSKKNIILSHYPMEEWPQMKHGGVHLHAHSHGKGRKLDGRLDCSVNVLLQEFGTPVVRLNELLTKGITDG